MAHQPVPADQLAVGRPLAWDVFDETGQLLLCEGYVLTRPSQIEVLQARGLYAEQQRRMATPQPVAATQPKRYDPFHLWQSIQDELEALLRNIRLEPEFGLQIASLSRLVATLVDRSPDTALASMILADQRRYPIAHSLHVAVICELAARRLEWSRERRQSLCCAAMTMNLAMLEVQAALCSQRRPPTPEQRREIQRHPQLAEEMLRAAQIEDEVWLRAVLEHHERADGCGYPFGIVKPTPESQLIRTADVFSAKVAPRAARLPFSPHEAAKSIFLEGGESQTNPFAAVLIKEVGLFPPGTFVHLRNGETGIVLRRGATAHNPQVVSLLSASGLSYGIPMRRDTTEKPHEIVAVVPRDKVRVLIDPERLWGAQ